MINSQCKMRRQRSGIMRLICIVMYASPYTQIRQRQSETPLEPSKNSTWHQSISVCCSSD